MELQTVPVNFIDRAWREGASCLSKACDTSHGEITGDQLKLILSRGERTLLRMVDNDVVVGWGAIRVDQLPNMRVLFVTDLVAPNGHFEMFFELIKGIGRDGGCSSLRCAAGPAQARLYAAKCGFKPVYQILEVPL